MRMNFAIWENCDPAKRNRIPTLQFRHETKSMIKIVNEEIITEYLEDTNTLEQIQTIIYSAASTVISCNNQKIREPAQRRKKAAKPRWQIGLERAVHKNLKYTPPDSEEIKSLQQKNTQHTNHITRETILQ